MGLFFIYLNLYPKLSKYLSMSISEPSKVSDQATFILALYNPLPHLFRMDCALYWIVLATSLSCPGVFPRRPRNSPVNRGGWSQSAAGTRMCRIQRSGLRGLRIRGCGFEVGVQVGFGAGFGARTVLAHAMRNRVAVQHVEIKVAPDERGDLADNSS